MSDQEFKGLCNLLFPREPDTLTLVKVVQFFDGSDRSSLDTFCLEGSDSETPNSQADAEVQEPKPAG